MYHNYRHFFAMLVAGLLLSSCNVTKHLNTAKGERLLVATSLDVKSEKRMGLSKKAAFSYETGGLYKQTPNKKAIFLPLRPRLAAWYQWHDKESKFANWIKNKYAESPAIYDSTLAEGTARNFTYYMRQRGYFHAVCTYKTEFIGDKKAKTYYTLTLGPQYRIKSTQFVSRDTAVQQIMREIANQSFLKPGAPIDSRQFDAEKIRITEALRNRGYANFISNFIEFAGDSTGTFADVTVVILPPKDDTISRHQVYTFDDVQAFSSLVPDLNGIRSVDTIEQVVYYSAFPKFWIKPRHLSKAITFRPGDIYRQEEVDRTNRNLSSMGAFRFVAVRPQADSLQKDKIDGFISYYPQNHFGAGYDINLNYTATGPQAGFFGGLAGVNLLNRNTFGGAENFQTSLQFSTDINFTKKKLSRFSSEFKFQNDLIIPRFIDYFGVWRTLNRLVSKRTPFFDALTKEGKTRISLTFDYLSIANFYEYNLFKTSFGYQFSQRNKTHSYALDHIGIDLLAPTLAGRFQNLCGSNPLLCLNFSNQLFTGIALRNFNYTYTSPLNNAGERWRLIANTEYSGAEVFVLNRVFEGPLNDDNIWKIKDIEFAKFIRGEITGIYNRSFSRNLAIALRVNTGLIRSYGGSEVPYVKQFYVGGPVSIRAWPIRGLGPGNFWDPKTANIQPNFQAGDFKFETNAEIRFPVFWWFKGAVFLDMGNVWNIGQDRALPGAELDWNFYKTMAIGTGAGIRLDADYFIIRFDVGLKIRRPYVYSETSGHWYKWYGGHSFSQLANYNLAVGYPF